MSHSPYPLTVLPLPQAEGGGYLVSFPDLPGCHGDGETVEAAIADGIVVLEECLSVLRSEGRPIPLPSGQFAAQYVRNVEAEVCDILSSALKLPVRMGDILSEIGQRAGLTRLRTHNSLFKPMQL